MPTRRTFLQSAAAVSAAPLAPGAVFARLGAPPAEVGVVFDRRHAPACALGRQAAQRSAAVSSIAGDITDLWQRELSVRWNAAPAAVAGLTERPALFLLERLAWDHGLRVVYHAEHEPLAGGLIAHRVFKAASAGLVCELEAAGAGWPVALAELMLGASRALTSRDYRPTEATMSGQLDEPVLLHSWIIAPRSAA